MADAAPIIHIGGWPGAGKLTIGRHFAKRIGARLIHNHLLLDAASALYQRGDPGWSAMREDIREVIRSHATDLPSSVPLVLTDALADEPASIPLFQPTLDLAGSRAAPLFCFVLDLTVAENMQRLTASDRAGAKLKDQDVLRRLRDTQTLFIPQGAAVLDVTEMSPEAVADVICETVGVH